MVHRSLVNYLKLLNKLNKKWRTYEQDLDLGRLKIQLFRQFLKVLKKSVSKIFKNREQILLRIKKPRFQKEIGVPVRNFSDKIFCSINQSISKLTDSLDWPVPMLPYQLAIKCCFESSQKLLKPHLYREFEN